jgi:hypothetical protein
MCTVRYTVINPMKMQLLQLCITEMKTFTLQPNNSMIKQKLLQMINFTISSFGGLDASVLPANAANRITETQNPMLLRSLCYVTCC